MPSSFSPNLGAAKTEAAERRLLAAILAVGSLASATTGQTPERAVAVFRETYAALNLKSLPE